MEKIKILVVEDEWVVSEEILEILEKNGFEVIGQAEDAVEALAIAGRHIPDIALLDINIKGDIDGIELAHMLKERHQCGVIFLTAYENQQYVNRATAVNPQAYIVKPFRESNIVIAIKLAFHNLAESQKEESENLYLLEDRVFIKEGSRFFKLELNKIRYVEANGSYCNIHTDKFKHTLAINLKNFESKVANPTLVRVHRSFLVNLQNIDAIEGNLLIVGDKSIPISQPYQEDVFKRLKLI